jgi:hypothetical protein
VIITHVLCPPSNEAVSTFRVNAVPSGTLPPESRMVCTASHDVELTDSNKFTKEFVEILPSDGSMHFMLKETVSEIEHLESTASKLKSMLFFNHFPLSPHLIGKPAS